MKLDFDSDTASLAITAYAPGWIRVGEQRIDQACVITTDNILLDVLPAAPAELDTGHFDLLAETGADIALLGTGARQAFPDPAMMVELNTRGIGLEVMDTGAACRSFNVLSAEGRAVVAMLYMI